MFSSIRVRLIFSHLAVILVAMSLSGFLLLSLLQQYFLQTMEASLADQAQITAQALIPGALVEGVTHGDLPAPAYNALQQQQNRIALQAQNVSPPLEDIPLSDLDLGYLTDASLQLSSQLDTRIRILDARGIVLLDSRQEEQGADLHSDPLVVEALAGD